MFEPVSVVEILQKEKQKDNSVAEFKSILSKDFLIEQGIIKDLSNSNQGHCLDKSLLDNHNIFSIQDIEKVCIDYRLRFLDSTHFKGVIPQEAIFKVRELKKQHKLDQLDLFLIAPSKKFSLADCDDDPLLFGRVNEHEYYLIYKWGNDLSWFRKLFFYPIRSLETLVISLVSLSIIAGMTTPIEWIATDPMAYDNPYIRVAWISKLLIIFCALTALLLGAFHKSLSSSQWQDNLFKR